MVMEKSWNFFFFLILFKDDGKICCQVCGNPESVIEGPLVGGTKY